MVPDAGELLFSIIFSYMGALEFFFIARSLYHWGFRHHKRMLELSDDPNSLNELQEQIKAAINEAKEKEMYGLNAMKDGVLYKEGFRVSPGTDIEKNDRQVIGSSRNSLEKKTDLASEVIESTKVTKNKSSVESKKQDKQSEFNVVSGEQQQEEVIEEPFVKKQINYELSQNYEEENKTTAAGDKRTNVTQTIKTQFGQTDTERYSLKPEANAIEKPGLTTTKSDDSSSNEPLSTHGSGFSNQQSSSVETTTSVPEMHFDEYNRPEPDGQDVNEPQYSDDYLRSLDGIKYRPLVRDDGTGRRRAFKKRRSSGDSTSSRESRASREEELKMFTSLEEEESEAIKRGDTDYAPIRYSSDPNLKVGKHSRRHKKSPVKGSRDSEESRSSLEMLDEEGGSPWGDVKPEHYKDMEFWKREKTTSIEEENENNSIEQEQAMQICASPSPARNIPKMSSFEDATRSEHENVIESLKRSHSRDAETADTKKSGNESSDNAKNVSMYESDEKASSPSPDSNLDASTTLRNDQKSLKTDENIVHDQQTDELLHRLGSKLRRSPRQDDMEYYEEQFIEEERKASRTPSPYRLKSKSAETLENKDEKEAETNDDGKSEISLSDRKTPKIEIDYAPDTENPEIQTVEDDWEEENEEQTTTLLEGVSDFYDFNASINPSRSPSRSSSRSPSIARSERRSQSQSRIPEKFEKSNKSRETSPYQERSRSVSPQNLLSTRDISGLSDWYDYNVMLNRRAYGIKVENFREIHESSTDFIISQLKTTNNIADRNENEPKNVERSSPDTVGGITKSRERSLTPEMEIDSENICTAVLNESSATTHGREHDDCHNSSVSKETISENSIQETHVMNQNEEPPTPQYPRSFSVEWRDIERIREEYKREFRRSRYVGESVDFCDEFDELREQTKHFRRSRSKSRTPNDQDIENLQIGKMAARRKLQEKILEQITKTTLDYQDFAKDINREFLDNERRGSDSALIQKSQILIQLQDNQFRNGEYYDDEDNLEAEEYHHFRRFSLNQEAQIEEYPDDDYVYEYIQQIDLTKGISTFEIDDFQSKAGFITEHMTPVLSISDEILKEPLDQIEADDQEDSGSDDERQTVVEVDDEIDEDICDFEKSDDQFNEQSECEEAEREVDRYVNHSARDWKEEGAVGGVTEWHNTNIERENVANIDDMYDDALRYIEEERMEKDYENIIEAMNNEEQNKTDDANDLSDNISMKTEDILEEILKDEEEKYRRLSPKQSTRHYLKSSSQNLIDREKENDEIGYYVSTATVVHHNTASTRLRSRYGLPPSTIYRNYDYDLDNTEVDLNYKPKKEYNWRKNFKIDDDDFTESGSTKRKQSPNSEENQNDEENENENENLKKYLDTRKYSLGGESITLYSRSLESEEKQLEIVSMEDGHTEQFENVIYTEMNHTFQENGESIQNKMDSNSQQNGKTFEESENKDIILETDQPDTVSKRKKIKKKSRKGSKASIGDEDLNNLNTTDLTKTDDDDQTTSVSKKKIKKKKKVKVDVISENSSPNIKSPEPENKMKPSELRTAKIDRNQSNDVFKSSKSNPPECTPFKTESILENSKTAVATRISPNPENISDTKISSPHLETENIIKTSPNRISKSPEPIKTNKEPLAEASGTQKSKPPLERKDSSGVYELIKDGSMYPWF